jgi:hypothetical protein
VHRSRASALPHFHVRRPPVEQNRRIDDDFPPQVSCLLQDALDFRAGNDQYDDFAESGRFLNGSAAAFGPRAGLHTQGEPLDAFADGTFNDLAEGKKEIGYGTSVARLSMSRDEIDVHAEKLYQATKNLIE